MTWKPGGCVRAMAETMLTVNRRKGWCQDSDLLCAGFSMRDIRACGREAALLARELLDREAA